MAQSNTETKDAPASELKRIVRCLNEDGYDIRVGDGEPILRMEGSEEWPNDLEFEYCGAGFTLDPNYSQKGYYTSYVAPPKELEIPVVMLDPMPLKKAFIRCVKLIEEMLEDLNT